MERQSVSSPLGDSSQSLIIASVTIEMEHVTSGDYCDSDDQDSRSEHKHSIMDIIRTLSEELPNQNNTENFNEAHDKKGEDVIENRSGSNSDDDGGDVKDELEEAASGNPIETTTAHIKEEILDETDPPRNVPKTRAKSRAASDQAQPGCSAAPSGRVMRPWSAVAKREGGAPSPAPGPNVEMQIEIDPMLHFPDLDNPDETSSLADSGYKQLLAAVWDVYEKNQAPRPVSQRRLKEYKCAECGKSFAKQKTLTKHQKLHLQVRPYQCEECDQSFIRNVDLVKHMGVHTGDKPFKCLECNKAYGFKSALIRHQVLHTEAKMLKCRHCEKEFSHRYVLNEHMKVHDVLKPFEVSEIMNPESKPFKCQICADNNQPVKSFTRKSHLERHQKSHLGIRPFECPVCEKTFMQLFDLKKHIKVHAGVKPYVCTYCEKLFSQKSNLMEHMRTHNGDKPYKCTNCEKAFAQKSNLTKHEMIHSGVRPYECMQCNKTFIQRSNLVKHLKFHSGIKPHKCPCGKGFVQRRDLLRHQNVHKNEILGC